ncbi:MAG: Fur family transcriptional regulator [Lishizhenia sp.]
MLEIAQDKLRSKQIKITRVRTNILAAFLSSDYALSYTDLQAILPDKEDKVTVYRTLKKFKEEGIIHEIEDENANKFAVCTHSCSKEEHYDSHAHFKCNSCTRIYCLETPDVNLSLPMGYQMQQYNLSIKGICMQCA